MVKKRFSIIIVFILCLGIFAGSFYCYFSVIPRQKERAERERLVKEYYDKKVKIYQAENEQYADYEVDVAFLGDSLTDGYDLKKYYPQYLTANRGIGGDTTFGLENRLQVSAIDLKPKVVVMLIGANNFHTMLDNYESILIKLKVGLPESKIVLLSLTAMGGDWAKNNDIAKQNNVEIKRLAEKYNYEFIDLFTPLLDPITNEVYDGYTVDGGHFTATGYEAVTAKISPVLERLL
ncbi:MAG: hypothetical protein IJC07_00135 [Clostridia bacterium]|nr:hypothetical protein [Clostridia bacterium]